MTKKLISNGLWFDSQAEEAAKFYTSVFAGSKIGNIVRYGKEGFEIHGRPEGSVMVVEFELAGEKFVAINGGPLFTFNQSISYFVVCESLEETDKTWNTLLENGKVLMPYQKYDWSEKYGWLTDRYGLSWQISYGKISDVGQKITPSLLFVQQQYGHAEEAIKFYTSIFKDSKVDGIMKHPAGGSEREGAVAHAQFSLAGQKFMIMESGMKEHEFNFNEAISIIINCQNQKEIDYYWDKFTAEGGQEVACGWLKDKFGVSWQVDSVELAAMLKDSDKEKVARVTKAFLKMKKFDVAKLREAFEGSVVVH
ncbi:VOC family protein [Chryseosolibacter indicus]|uniref:VOC family protein n=1 Tax=Chryseosolibacter indicus TaxID=2782351 RepID=A0ABS5VY99_9BACT|nr:VOC family protein [Chryseosolibacter indicus]MBT1706389.1 VOC family protein [Chryseosolibacter indicus]